MSTTKILIVLFGLACPAPTLAWNGFGHMTVAAVAYKKLNPAVATKVSTLLQLNPDYATWIANVPAKNRDMIAFLMAATWPDVIKGEAGYTNDGNQPSGPDSGRNIGYFDKLQHRYWHYIDEPFSPDGTAMKQPVPPNARTQITLFRTTLTSPTANDDVKSYDLVWLLHLVGDVHQPLHCTSRFDKQQPNGDQGGNLVSLCKLPCKDELHVLWDDLLGIQTDPNAAIKRASTLATPDPILSAIADEATWIAESLQAAEHSVYIAPIEVGPGPFTVNAKYKKQAQALAVKRVALAGARLANLLNDALK
jgi:hypothetical protein